MNTLQPIKIAHSLRPCCNVKYVPQSAHMHSAITVMKMNIIVQSGTKMVFRSLPDQILLSLWNLRVRLRECRGNRFRKRKKGRRNAKVEKRRSTALTSLLNTYKHNQKNAPRLAGVAVLYSPLLHPSIPPEFTFIAGVLVHKVFHGWDLTALDAKNPSSNAI